MRRQTSTWYYVVSYVVALCFAGTVVMAGLVGMLYYYNQQNVKTLNGVFPLDGNIDIDAGDGIAVTPGVNSALFESTGFVTINGLSSDSTTKDILIVGTSPGLNVSSSGSTITLTNPGVITMNGLPAIDGDIAIVATDGLDATVVDSTTTFHHIRTRDVALDDTDAAGNVATYYVAIGFLNPVVANAGWQCGVTTDFPIDFFPGAVDSSAGDAAGVAWAVPATGLYHVSGDCQITPSAMAPDDLMVAHVAFSLGAGSVDPEASPAYLPPGAYGSMNLAVGTNGLTPPTLPFRISLAATFQAGCSGCLAQATDVLNIHASLLHTSGIKRGAPPPYTADFLCKVQVTQLI